MDTVVNVARRPWMSDAEIELISSTLRAEDTMIEWGAGGSTIFFSPMVRNYFSIEHNAAWAQAVHMQSPKNVSIKLIERENIESFADEDFQSVRRERKKTAQLPESTFQNSAINQDVRHLSSFSWKRYMVYRKYVEGIADFKTGLFDKVLIDGRARVACALYCRKFLAKNAVVFVHDFFKSERKDYREILDYFEVIGASQKPPGLVALKLLEEK